MAKHTVCAVAPSMQQETIASSTRIQSIDFLRGVVMIIMALDHIRDFFHFDAFLYSPTDLSQTSPILFATRWITHLCAPTFIFLSGTSAYLVCIRKGKKETTKFLLTRGAWLVFLQLTVIIFGWTFDIFLHYNGFDIISTIGFCMMLLAVLIHLPLKALLVISLIIIFGHNAFDSVGFPENTVIDFIWSFLHVFKTFRSDNGYVWDVPYPLVPWVGVMALGYCLGTLYVKDFSSTERKKILISLGLASLAFFLMLRWLNVYGDPQPWTIQKNALYTVMSFLNLTKYPPSLLYLFPTLGITLLLLALLDEKKPSKLNPVIIFGKVPMFYYIIHIYLIHLVAMCAAVLTGHSWRSMIFYEWLSDNAPLLKGSYGFTLGSVFIIWIAIVIVLYPLCVWFNKLKTKNRNKWWVSYI